MSVTSIETISLLEDSMPGDVTPEVTSLSSDWGYLGSLSESEHLLTNDAFPTSEVKMESLIMNYDDDEEMSFVIESDDVKYELTQFNCNESRPVYSEEPDIKPIIANSEESATDEVANDVTVNLTDDVIEALTDDVIGNLTDDVIEDATDDVTEDLTDDLIEDVKPIPIIKEGSSKGDDAALSSSTQANSFDENFQDDAATINGHEDSLFEGPDNTAIPAIVICRAESVVEDPNMILEATSERELSALSETSPQVTPLVYQKPQKIAFKCNLCTFSATTRFSLYRHEARHKQCLPDSSTVVKECSDRKHQNVNGSEGFVSQKRIDKSVTFRCDTCTFSAHTRFALARHQACHKLNGRDSASPKVDSVKNFNTCNPGGISKLKIFKCRYCSFTSKIRFALKRHVMTHSGISETVSTTSASLVANLKCEICFYQGESKKDLLIHLLKAHKKQNLKCVRCQRLVPVQMKNEHSINCMKKYRELLKRGDKNNLGSINLSVAKETQLFCDYCSFATDKQQNLDKHLKLHTAYNRPIYSCNICEYKSTRINLTKHIKFVHEKKSKTTVSSHKTKSEIISCELCSFTTKYAHIMKRHANLHTANEPVLSCLKCDYKSTRYNIARHSLVVHREKYRSVAGYSCQFCSFKTNIEKSFKSHVDLHTVCNEPILSSLSCDYKDTYRNINKHSLDVHGTEFNVLNHKKTSQESEEDNQAVYSCTHCQFRTESATSFKQHQLLHIEQKGDKPELFNCEFCSYISNSPWNLVRHRQQHTIKNELILSCNKCNYKSTRLNLLHHYRNAHKLNKDKVQLLLKAGTTKFQLKQRNVLQTVFKRPIYSCDQCNYRSSKLNVSKHLKVVHGKDSKKNTYKYKLSVATGGESNRHSEPADTRRCKFCSYTTKNEPYFEKHVKLHTEYNTPVYQCSQCNYKAAKVSLAKHSKRAHGVKFSFHAVHCRYCSFTARQKNALKRHERKHTIYNQTNYQCDQADYKSTARNLSLQIKSHGKSSRNQLSDVPDKMEVAANASSANYPNQTEKLSNSDKLNKRNITSKKETDPVNSTTIHSGVIKNDNIHTSANSGPIFFACEICEYVTNNKATLISHKLAHADSKIPNDPLFQKTEVHFEREIVLKGNTITCSKCKRHFVNKAGFCNHVCERDTRQYTSHVNGRMVTYQCRGCSVVSSVKGAIIRHFNKWHISSSSKKRFACSLCYFRTTYLHYLKAHKLRRHGVPGKTDDVKNR